MQIPLPTGKGGPLREGRRVRGTALRPISNSPELFIDRARQMRREDNRAEKKAWNQLKDHRTLGLKFRRQVPIDRYIVDFIVMKSASLLKSMAVFMISLDRRSGMPRGAHGSRNLDTKFCE